MRYFSWYKGIQSLTGSVEHWQLVQVNGYMSLIGYKCVIFTTFVTLFVYRKLNLINWNPFRKCTFFIVNDILRCWLLKKSRILFLVIWALKFNPWPSKWNKNTRPKREGLMKQELNKSLKHPQVWDLGWGKWNIEISVIYSDYFQP